MLALAVVAALGIFFFQKLRKYNSYTVEKSVERQDTAGSQFLAYGNGFIKYSNDGAIYTDANDEVYWNQTYEMKEPMADVCEDYVALADKGGTEIYIMNQAGMQGKIETPMNISRISVANQGVVAVWMESDGENYIRMYDKNGKNLVSGAFYTEKSGYPLDISLCNDGKKLAVSMLTVNNGEVCSTIKYYNFGSVGQNEIDNNVGTYTYDDTFISEISYVASNRMIAIEDSGYIVFEGAQKPAPKREVKFKTEVQSVFYDNKYVGIVYSSPKKEGCWNIKVYDMAGKTVMENETTIAYDKIEFLDNNEICVRNTHDCELYTIHGIRKFSYTFDKDIYKILSGSDSQSYTFVFNGERDEVRLQ